MPRVLDDLPDEVVALAEAFVEGLRATLGERFEGLFLYGAACFPPSPVADFDGHVIVTGPFTDSDRAKVWEMLERIRPLPLGDELDVWYVTTQAIRSSEKPQTELKPGFHDDSWALHRAHVHGGRYVRVTGPDPRELVPEPTWVEIDEALQGELDYVNSHLDDAPAFCVLNLCRILYSYATRDVVTSKLRSAVWAHAALPVEHHGLVRDALAAYANKEYASVDARAFHGEMTDRIARARSTVA